MRETAQDLIALQALLDDTYASAGKHLLEIHTPKARLTAVEVVKRLVGMKVMVVATTSRDGRPLTGPVDTFFHRGHVCFGTSVNAFRARHLAQRPDVSITYADGEATTVSVHGSVVTFDPHDSETDFADVAREHYGPEFDEWDIGAVYYRIIPSRMLAADMSVHTQG